MHKGDDYDDDDDDDDDDNNNNNNNNNRIGITLKQQVLCFHRNTELVILRACAKHHTPTVMSRKG